MNAKSTRIVGIGAALALAGLLWGVATTARAQGIPQPAVSSETCDQVQWSPKLVAQYPNIADACQEVVSVNGENWVRVEGRLLNVNPNGSVTSMVLDRQGRRMTRMTLKPAVGQKVVFEGKERTFDDLNTGAILNLYIPEHMYAVATVPSEPSEMAAIEPAPETEVAESMPEQLPAAAGPLPWVLLAGGVILLAGLGLTLGRRLMR